MSEDREKELLRLAEAVSDGTPVDWEEERGSHPGIKEPLEHLAVLDRVRKVHEESSRVLIGAGRGSQEAPRIQSVDGAARKRWIAWLVAALAFAVAALVALAVLELREKH